MEVSYRFKLEDGKSPNMTSTDGHLTSALGHYRTFSEVCAMSALPPKADIHERNWNVRFVPDSEGPAGR
jgi:hypothetical protein